VKGTEVQYAHLVKTQLPLAARFVVGARSRKSCGPTERTTRCGAVINDATLDPP
jgi:hypothetical protein